MTPPAPDLRAAYAAALARHGHQSDPAQLAAVDRLEALASRLHASPRATGGLSRLLGRLRGGPAGPGERGLYLWGGVGRGKTFLMDLFHAQLEVPARREHFRALLHDRGRDSFDLEHRRQSGRDRDVVFDEQDAPYRCRH